MTDNEQVNLLNQLPLLYFKKDPDSYYSFVSHQILKWNLINRLDECIGKNDFDMPWANEAEIYIKQDQLSLKGISQFNIDSLPKRDGTTLLHFCYKKPVYNESGKITGVGGFGFELTLENYKNIFSALALSGLNFEHFRITPDKKKLEFIYKDVRFTRREAQLIGLLLRGHSAESTANELKLSKRTIEFYMSLLKEKLDCHRKHELINKAFEMGFIDLMFMKFS
jgi:DNA-binding CsgD family transcriptional regulator